MYYRISCIDPNQHLLRIEVHIGGLEEEELELRMPAWRPGRYQMAHFARYIMRMGARSPDGSPLELFKTEKDRWTVRTEGYEELWVSYTYYAHVMDAGSTYVDEEQLYLNPISSLIFLPERSREEHRLEPLVPVNYRIATGLDQEDDGTLSAPDLHTLMDGPFIASAGLKHHAFVRNGIRFHIWFQGECKLGPEKLQEDLIPLIDRQITAFGEFPVDEYHFLYQVLPYRTRHGVEHASSTVIVLGPSFELSQDRGYEDLLAISSHELYHSWNVKRIRPSAMMPYDFTRENYTRLGYMAEGVTTYMGDLMLLRSGFYSTERYLEKVAGLIQRHFDNAGRHNLSVADSSFDTWLDGYDREVPGRKVSIYNEGALIAFILDVRIRKETGDEKSLDDLMARLYEDFAKKGKGFTEEELRSLAEEIAGASLNDIWEELIGGTSDHTPFLEESLAYLGIEWRSFPKELYHEAWLGFRTRDERGAPRIVTVHPRSPAKEAGLEPGDRILGVNGFEVNFEDLGGWCEYFGEGSMIGLTLVRDGRILERMLRPSNTPSFRSHQLLKKEEQNPSFKVWAALSGP